jgi:TonB-dependent receptor
MFTRHSHITRTKSALLGSSILVGAASLLLTATPAIAQATDQGVETVVVTGYRASLQDATNFKRNSVGFNDSVFAEDIGKFPDANVAEALNRIPGINITREADNEGLQVAIRGLGANFTKILLNGAPIAVASSGATDQNTNNREVDLNMFPTELFTQLTVAKTPTADMIEGGLAGDVGMRTLRPFDNPGMHFTYDLQGTDYSQGATFGQRGSVLFSDTEGPFGVLVGALLVHNNMYTTGWEDGNAGWYTMGLSAAQCPACVYSGSGINMVGGNEWSLPATIPGLQQNPSVAAVNIQIPGQPAGTYYAAGTPINAAWLAANDPAVTGIQLGNAMMPRLGRQMFELGSRDRANAVASFEYRPSDDLHFYLDTIFGRIVNNFNRSDMDQGFRSGTGSTLMIPTGATVNSNDVLTSATFYNPSFFLEYRPYVEHEDFLSLNPGGEWQPIDMLTIDVQGYVTRSHFFRDQSDFLAVTPPSQGYVAGTLAGTSGPAAPAGGAWATWNNVNQNYPLVTTNLNLNDPNIYGWVQSEQSSTSPVGSGRLDLALEDRYTTTYGYHLDATYGGDEFSVKVGGAFDDVRRSILAAAGGQLWQNAVCGDGPSINIPGQNYLGCYGMNTPTPGTALAGVPGVTVPTYPGYGTGYTAGQTGTLTWLGSLVPEASVPQMLQPGPRGWVTGNKSAFYKMTNYAYWKNYSMAAFTPAINPLDGRLEYPYPFATGTVGNYNTGIFEEKNWGYYVEVNGKFDIGGHDLKYNAGFRWVETYENIYSPTLDPAIATANASLGYGGKWPNEYYLALAKSTWQSFLPSASVSYNASDDLVLRASVSRTLGRANPTSEISQVVFGDVLAQNATLGNPALKPYFSNNVDIGGEYYTGGEGYIGLTGFYKIITGWPGSSQYNTTLGALQAWGITWNNLSSTQQANLALNNGGCASESACANAPIVMHTTLNLPGALHIEGLELDYVQPLDFALEQYGLKGFGVTANSTFISQYSGGAAPVHAGGVPTLEYNATAYYENDGIMARASWTFTGSNYQANPGAQVNICLPNSSYSSTTAGCQGPWYKTASHGELDVSSSLKLSKLLGELPTDPEMTFDVTNLNRAKLRVYDMYPSAIHSYYAPGSLFVLGFRGSF